MIALAGIVELGWSLVGAAGVLVLGLVAFVALEAIADRRQQRADRRSLAAMPPSQREFQIRPTSRARRDVRRPGS